MIKIRFVLLCMCALLAGCASPAYYWQAASGQLEIWRKSRPIENVMADDAQPDELKQQLKLAARLREFASRELALPDNRSYRVYADLQRPYAVWNVFAAPEFSMHPREWCFPFAGCVNYRGYFSREGAEDYAATLRADGYDVYVGGVPAYSTLGWFDDPLLNTFIRYSDAQLAQLLFHELAHQVLYVAGDTTFNESFAVTVEQEGVQRWLACCGSAAERVRHAAAQAARAEFVALVRRTRERLEALYRSGIGAVEMRAEKVHILGEMRAEYEQHRDEWGAAYERFFAQELNNAQFAAVAAYSDWLQAFQALLAREGGDLARFYAAVRELAKLPKEARVARLNSFAQ
ncbi:MAG: aminopeptidase [Pseudomonadota bacterium]